MQSFCLYCAVGILAVYIYQATIFTAAFSLDQRRIESRRNGCLPFIKHKNWEPNSLSQRDIAQESFEKFGKFIMRPVSKVCVLLFTIGVLSVGGWHTFRILANAQINLEAEARPEADKADLEPPNHTN